MRVALQETETAWQDPAANRVLVEAALGAGDLDAVDLAVYCELTFSGFTMDPVPDAEAEPFLQSLAARRDQALIAGYVGEGPANVAVAVDRAGQVVARYEKLHPFSYAGEDKHYRAGNALPVFELDGLKAAMLICYDLRFPEAFRDAALNGAEAIFVIANWPEARVHHWRALLVARAIENQCYVVGVNRIGSDPHVAYESSSMAIDPLGEVLLEGPGIVDLDPARVAEVRRELPFLKDVRTDRYPF